MAKRRSFRITKEKEIGEKMIMTVCGLKVSVCVHVLLCGCDCV